MNTLLLQYLAQIPGLTDAEKSVIAQHIPVMGCKKGALLLSDGEVASKCYFVLQGCIRQYVLLDGEEKTTAFYTEEQAAVAFTSYTQGVPANLYWVCVEDCVLIVGEQAKEQEMYQQFPQLETMTRGMMASGFGKQQEEFATFIVSSPEERYRNLLASRPNLLQRAPQHQIASYLGVTPESLSRIRKRIHGRK